MNNHDPIEDESRLLTLHQAQSPRVRSGAMLLLALFAACAALPTRAAEESSPRRLKRADSFLGIHFDFHAGPDCTEIGRNTTAAMIENIIDIVRPDYLQTDCKGHRGLTSYPTGAGNPAPGFVAIR